MIKLSELSVHVIQNSTIRHTCPKGKLFLFPSLKHPGDRGGGGKYFRNFWVGMCHWDPGTLSLYQN